MRTDGLFTVHGVEVRNWRSSRTLKLIPFGDIHRDSPSHADGHWAKFLAYARSPACKDALFLGMGDYTDSFSTSERMVVYNGARHESTSKRQEKEERGRIELLHKELSFMKGKLVGLLGGNHFMQFANGSTGDMLLAEMLETQYLGVCSAIRITFTFGNKSSRACVDIFAHHGRGAGQTAGGKFNAVERLLNVCDCDIALMGDNHARGCFPAGSRLYLAHGNGRLCIRSKARWIGRTGSFLKSYEDGERNYVVDGALSPANLGWIEFQLTPFHEHGKGTGIEICAKQ